MNHTDIKLSKKLLELGLDPKTADICYKTVDVDGADSDKDLVFDLICKPYREYLDYVIPMGLNYRAIPCWSLNALLEMIPQYNLRGPYSKGGDYCCWSTSEDFVDLDCYGKTAIEAVSGFIVEIKKIEKELHDPINGELVEPDYHVVKVGDDNIKEILETFKDIREAARYAEVQTDLWDFEIALKENPKILCNVIQERPSGKIHGWIGRDKDGTLRFCYYRPRRENQIEQTWWGSCDADFDIYDDTLEAPFKDLTWDDEPVEVTLEIKRL